MSMLVAHPHIKVYDEGSTFEHCEDPGCVADADGHASCGRLACHAWRAAA